MNRVKEIKGHGAVATVYALLPVDRMAKARYRVTFRKDGESYKTKTFSDRVTASDHADEFVEQARLGRLRAELFRKKKKKVKADRHAKRDAERAKRADILRRKRAARAKARRKASR